MKKGFKILTAVMLLTALLFSTAAVYAEENHYVPFVRGTKTTGLKFKDKGLASFNSEIYWSIKKKYPTDVPDKVLFTGARKELVLLAKAYGIDPSFIASQPPESTILATFVKKYKGKVSPKLAVYASARGMIKSLNDPECELILPSTSKNPRRDLVPEGYGGLGILIELREGEVIIIEPFKGGAGESAGLKAGDRILSIDGVSVKGLDLDTVMNKLRGKINSQVKVKFSRKGNAFTRTLKRTKVTPNPVEVGVSKDGTGYVKIVFFGDKYPEFVYNALEKFKAQGINRWVLDLRDNAGGALNNYIIMASLFVPLKQPVAVMKYRDKDKTMKSAGRVQLQAPAAVLVNRYTTGSAEVLAQTLREYRNVRIYGDYTRGSAAVAEFFKLSGGATLKMTIGSMTSGKGKVIHTKRVTPDIKVRGINDPANSDVVITKVLNHLNSK